MTQKHICTIVKGSGTNESGKLETVNLVKRSTSAYGNLRNHKHVNPY